MSMIKIENLSFSYPSSGDPVFENVNFQIDTDWKLGFVGRNGRGKTTLLNLLMGTYEYSGKIISSVQFDYFPYPVPDKGRFTGEILGEVCPQAQEWELVRELSLLGMESGVLWRPFDTLSGGEQTRVLLAALFLNQGHFLLIDEPTNHLDREARDMVSAYLQRKKGFILVSHDRRFLDRWVAHILALNRTSIDVQTGNFSSWMTDFKRQQAHEQAQNEHLKKDIRRLKEAARRSSQWSDKVEASKIGAADKGYVGHKAAKMMKRSKNIEARQQQAIQQKSGLLKNAETAESLKLLPLTYHAETLASFSGVTISYGAEPEAGPLPLTAGTAFTSPEPKLVFSGAAMGGTTQEQPSSLRPGSASANPGQAQRTGLFPPVTFAIRRGDRLALEGPNGSGKTSLLKLLLGEPVPHTGTVATGSGLVISYVPQDTSWLAGSLSDFAARRQIGESLFKAVLRKMDFERVQFEKDMADLSAGQKKKVLLAASLCQQAHLYVWDEPLNYIDLYSRMQVEQLILEFAPTMVFVEHDQVFRETIATGTVRI